MVEARREGATLVLLVRDNGGGQPAGGFVREGIGLANTRARLQELYGDRHRFELANLAVRGLEVRPDPARMKIRTLIVDDEPRWRASGCAVF